MNKKEMVAKIAKKTGQTQKNVGVTVDSFCELIVKALENGENVRLLGFGTFETRKRAARPGKNPRTGETVAIPACTVPVFKAGKVLKNKINKS